MNTSDMNKYFVIAGFLLSVVLLNICFHWFSAAQSPSFAELPRPKSLRRCHLKIQHPVRAANGSATPPWFSLLADYNTTIRSGKNLYLWPQSESVSGLRLGNRLFNYAATFGIAWRNDRIPVWPQRSITLEQYDITKFFNLRIPQDENVNIIKVISVLCYLVLNYSTICLKYVVISCFVILEFRLDFCWSWIWFSLV